MTQPSGTPRRGRPPNTRANLTIPAAMLTAAMDSRDLSAEQLAGSFPVFKAHLDRRDPATVRRWANGENAPSKDYAAVLDEMLGFNGALLTAWYPQVIPLATQTNPADQAAPSAEPSPTIPSTQSEPAESPRTRPVDPDPVPGRRSRLFANRTALIGVPTAVVVVIATVAVVVHANRNDSGKQASPRSAPITAQLNSPSNHASVTLDRSNLCTWHLGTHPAPTITTQPLVVELDDRCNYPSDPDPSTDQPTSIKTRPDKTSTTVGKVPDGTLVTITCYRTGATVSDAASPPNRSNIWLKLAKPDGYLPDVNVGGGFTTQQLQRLHIPICP